MNDDDITACTNTGAHEFVVNYVRVPFTQSTMIGSLINQCIDDMNFPTEIVLENKEYIIDEPINIYKSNIKIIGNGATIVAKTELDYFFYISNSATPVIKGPVYSIKDRVHHDSFVVKADGAFRYFKEGEHVCIKINDIHIYRKILKVKNYECFDKILLNAPVMYSFSKAEIYKYENKRIKNIKIEELELVTIDKNHSILIDNAENIVLSDIQCNEKLLKIKRDVCYVSISRCIWKGNSKYSCEFLGNMCFFQDCEGNIYIYEDTVGPSVFYKCKGIITYDKTFGIIVRDEEYEQQKIIYQRKNNDYYLSHS